MRRPAPIEVYLEYGAKALVMRVVDDGTGILPGSLEAAASGEHLGLAGMRDRAQRAGGQLELNSQPGKGTTVAVSLPIKAERAH
jgi:signal transduction histidine kinase